MLKYFHSITQKKTYKLHCTDDQTYVYWVSVYATTEGAFVHARGRDVFKDKCTALNYLEFLAKPCRESDYMDALKDYFQIDKAHREQFLASLQTKKRN
ncbi:hypothetical protein DN752_17900 [Echinicola strongylocentroti]|uniref:Uncharacterized protein n=1 Tax=Echinicola strongylocentroti TaxID=1795355 RepID=A0A2Z4ILT9_9BACT|nr:hypothetical protein [Echinicola strongylocentroti]AWW31854.1 hypothetical protein DN752_17900 [Echinicola strongylocentroti]